MAVRGRLWLGVLYFGAGLLSPGGTNAEILSRTPLHPPSGEVVYSRLVDTNEKRGEGRPKALPASGKVPRFQWQGFDLFLQTLPSGRTIRLTDHRHSKELGAVMEDVTFDHTGQFVAFLAPRKRVREHRGMEMSLCCLWVINVATRAATLVALPGPALGYSWSPTGSRLVVITGTINAPRLLLFDAQSHSVRPLFGANAFPLCPWAWWGNGRGIVYEDTPAHRLLRRSVRTGQITAQWREPKGMTVVSLYPAPDRQRMLVCTGSNFYMAVPHQALTEAFRVERCADDSPLWATDSQKLLLHTFTDIPPDDGLGSLPTETDHVIQAWDAQGRRWLPPLLSWTDGVTPPWRYSLLAGPDAKNWLVVTESNMPATDGLPRLLAIDLGSKKQEQLWKASSLILSLDLHEVDGKITPPSH
jgi:hypothetical protein